MSHRILLILPAYNVERGFEDILSQVPRSHTLIVDDGSYDSTYEVAMDLGFSVVRHTANLGVSAAIRTGESYARLHDYTHVILMDADGQHPPHLLDTFRHALSKSDFVLGDRFGHLEGIPPQKIASNLFASLLIDEVVGVFIRDVSCGYRGYRLSQRTSRNVISGYSEIYRKVIFNALTGVMPMRIPVPAIYDTTFPVATKRSEVLAVCNALSLFVADNPLLAHILDLANTRENITAQVGPASFSALYYPDFDSYVFTTDTSQAIALYGD
ncbi:glycosyltransferase family 2 protein [Geomonas sp. RF6]|uniref:glycosyltransferase family 2 protein n=1 Tax=Geomonas sp. RF6 TaxID=2897342 RepID=UPI001E468AA0|nr:glycosyltransferase family 2 protein [Geomonas sp. RF6]UFS70254.1 glycosyltransferase family 2 protein [Geomonas sp. RF6]